jgi:hypothetical protein
MARKGSVLAAVERDLEALARRDQDLASSGLAATALTMARALDDPKNSATSKSMCARVLSDTLARLRALAPAAEERDGLDDLSARRAARRAGGAA